MNSAVPLFLLNTQPPHPPPISEAVFDNGDLPSAPTQQLSSGRSSGRRFTCSRFRLASTVGFLKTQCKLLIPFIAFLCEYNNFTTKINLCQYKKKSALKETTYECGAIPFDDAKIKFDIKYFNYAILFLIFDIETVFLYPFAISINSLGLFAIIEAFLFVGILLFGLIFAIKKDILRWV